MSGLVTIAASTPAVTVGRIAASSWGLLRGATAAAIPTATAPMMTKVSASSGANVNSAARSSAISAMNARLPMRPSSKRRKRCTPAGIGNVNTSGR